MVARVEFLQESENGMEDKHCCVSKKLPRQKSVEQFRMQSARA